MTWKPLICIVWAGKAVPVNRRLAVGKGRVYSEPQYKRFIESMAWTIKAGRYAQIKGRLCVHLELEIPSRMDVDALMKPCCDAIQMSGLIADDNQIECLTAERVGKARGESRIRFLISEVSGT